MVRFCGNAHDEPRLQRIFLLWEEGEKEALEHFKQVIKICSNMWHTFSEQITEYVSGDTEKIIIFTSRCLDV